MSTKGIVCSEADLQRQLEDPLAIYCLSRGESMGLMLVAQSGIVSLLAVIYVFGIIIRNAFRRRKQQGKRWRMFEEPTDLLLASLYAIDLVQSVGAIFNVAWLNRGKVEIGGVCQAQGVVKQMGEVGVAFNTILITAYTFSALWLGRQVRSMRLTAVMVTLAWIIPAILVAAPNLSVGDRLHGPVPLWCWITKRHDTWRIMGEYLWMWIALSICVLGYIPVYFWNRGNLVPHERVWWRFHIRSASCSQIDCELRRKSFIMLLYPLTYSIVIVPLTVIRFLTFGKEDNPNAKPMPAWATVLAGVLFASSGALNVVLYLRTRPDTALFRRGKRRSEALPPSVELEESCWAAKADKGSARDADDLNDIETLGRLPSTLSTT